jgi:hypothetical protein
VAFSVPERAEYTYITHITFYKFTCTAQAGLSFESSWYPDSVSSPGCSVVNGVQQQSSSIRLRDSAGFAPVFPASFPVRNFLHKKSLFPQACRKGFGASQINKKSPAHARVTYPYADFLTTFPWLSLLYHRYDTKASMV